MSDLLGGGGPSTSNNNGRGGSSGRPQAAPIPTGSPSNVRGPREIMRDRVLREQRRKEQQGRENLERARAEEEARLNEERRKTAERRTAPAAGAVGGQQRGSGESSQRVSGGTAGQRISDNSQRSDRRSGERVSGGDPNQPLQGVGRGGHAVGGGVTGSSSRPRPTQNNQQPRPVAQETFQEPVNQPRERRPKSPERPPADPVQAARPTATRSSFPHAFERWETLSAHWEGLTSFWLRRLEQNSSEIERDPLSQQLSRQVTDLSAAGANLFHAVVELQRLRVSSERKFQRWFFDTRTEMERLNETNALSEKALQSERDTRDTAIRKAVQEALEKEKAQNGANNDAKYEKQLAELKRELQISKEESRRAWEELGRREQEERERTASLRDGHPTLVGGVQVVPMMQGVPSRHGSARERPQTREGLYQGGASSVHGTQPAEDPVDNSDIAYQQYSQSQRADPADPFVETRPAASSVARSNIPASSVSTTTYTTESSGAPAVQPASSSFYQQQQGVHLHPVEREERYGHSVASEGALSDDEYEIDATGDFIRDSRGNKVRYPAPLSDEDADEYDVAAEREREIANLQRYGTTSGIEYRDPLAQANRVTAPAPTSNPTASGPDYSGQGYGSGPGWEAVPRHHHPTRLSDVLEEDERSRTSASQVSRRE